MKRGDPLWVLVQGVGIVLAVLIIATGVVLRIKQPLDRETLYIAVAKIRSEANEAIELLSERDARIAPDLFVQQHAGQLQKLVSADVDALAQKKVPKVLAGYKKVALTQGEALRKLLGLVDLSATREDAVEIEDELAEAAARLKPQS